MRSPIRRVAAVVLCGCALAIGMVAAPAIAAAAPACRTAQLAVWLDTQSNGAAGTIFYRLNFTNVGARCTLRGYPGVSAVGPSGTRLGSPARRDASKSPRTVTLGAPNALRDRFSTASTEIGIVDLGALPTDACGPTVASGLRVYPPNQTAAAFVPYPFAACSRSGQPFLSVRAIAR